MNFGVGTRPVTVWIETGDRFGDAVISDERVIWGCAWAPQISAESTNYRTATVTTGIVLYAPPDANLSAQHRIRLDDGTVWRVTGDPGFFRNPIGGTDEGVQAHLERVTG